MRSMILKKTLVVLLCSSAFRIDRPGGASTKRRFLGVVFFALLGFSTGPVV